MIIFFFIFIIGILILIYRFLEDVLDSTFQLLSIHYSTAVGAPAHMTPIHYLALVDTKAYWFKKWMVSQRIP